MRKLRAWKINDEEKYGHQDHDRTLAFRAAVTALGGWEVVQQVVRDAFDLPRTKMEFDDKHWDYVQVVDRDQYRRYHNGGNYGAQDWRHQMTGITIPDYCRLTGGRPELWGHTRRRQVEIHPKSPILEYIERHGDPMPKVRRKDWLG